jgi:hypothetical protein
MQVQRIAGESGLSVRLGSVSGLGVCDAWRLELSAVQWPWLLDELDTLREVLEAALACARDDAADRRSEIEAREYELRLLAMIRAQLPPRDRAAAAVLVGPAELLRGLVAGTLRHVVDALSDLVDSQRLNDARARERLLETAEAAHAWARTVADCRSLETFSFDPSADPVPVR